MLLLIFFKLKIKGTIVSQLINLLPKNISNVDIIKSLMVFFKKIYQ